MSTIWIFIEDKAKFQHLEKEDPRLEWWPNGPHNMVKFTPRKNSVNYMYVRYGDTKEDCLKLINQYTEEKIEKYMQKVEQLRANFWVLDEDGKAKRWAEWVEMQVSEIF